VLARLGSGLCTVLALAGPAWADAPAPAEALSRVDIGTTWTLRTENDKFSTVPGGTDHYYTAGNQISVMSAPGRVPEVAADIARFLWGDGTTWAGFSLGQQLYTPTDTGRVHPDPLDHPYAGYLSATATLIQDVGNTRNVLSTSLGVIGPAALGRQVQNGFHSIIDSPQVRGWGSQQNNEPAVEITASRIWRVALVSAGPIETDVLPALTIGLGTVRDYAQLGGRLRLGHGLNRDYGPSRITDGLNGEDAFLPGEGLGYYAFAGASGQAVARDAFLDGALFGRSPSVYRRSVIAQFEAGVAVLWGGTRLSYTHTWQTDSFRGQKVGLFNYGSIAASMRF